MIQFANPAMLWLLPVAALPVLIHLFNRRRARPHPFAAIDFVLRSERRTSRRLRLRRLLLFAVRTILLLALPVALARPQRREVDSPARAPGGPAAMAFVLDASLSMNYVVGERTLFERAREQLASALASSPAENPATFLACTASIEPPEAPTFDRAKVRRKLDAAPQTFAPSDMTACVAAAARSLAESPLKGKRIVLATDLTAGAFHLDVPAPVAHTAQGDVRPEVEILDAAGTSLPNRAVASLSLEPASAVGHRAFQFAFTVRNHAPEALKDLTAVLRVGDDVVAKGFLDVPARGAATKTLTYQFPRGGVFEGRVEIAGDSLSADDARHFALRVPKEVRALVIDGSPNPVRFRDEAFFVEAAFTAPGSPVAPTIRDAESVADERFADYDEVMLLNVRELPGPRLVELDEFVKAGGGLLVSLGTEVDPDRYEGGIGALLPRKLHVVKTASERGTDAARSSAARFGSADFTHPALSVFQGEVRAGFLASRTYRYFLVQPGSDAVRVLASYDDGAPALLESARGRGRVVLYTSTVDRDWSDWPIQPSFLPAIQRVASHLAGLLDEREGKSYLVGEPAALSPSPGVELAIALGPDGGELPVERGEKGPAVTATTVPGVYHVRGRVAKEPEKPVPELAFAVNVDPRESDLTRLEERELVAYFGEGTRTSSTTDAAKGRREVPVWTALLAAALAAFAFEGMLLRR